MPTPQTTGTATDQTSGSTAPDPTSGNQFMQALQDTLMKQSGIISSSNSNIESSIGAAIKGVNDSNAASNAAIESKYGRAIGYQADQNHTAETAFGEKRTGFATPVVAFANLREYNQKSIRDLEDRKNELIMQGDSAAAGKVADLQLQKLQFEQQAAQKTFDNLLSTGTFALNADKQQFDKGIASRQETRAEKAQSFTERSAIGAVALQYGLQVEPGDTIDSVISRAAPMASSEQKLKLEQMRASINASNASASASYAAAAKAAKEDKALTPTDITALANGYLKAPDAVTKLLKDPSQLGSILTEVGNITFQQTKDQVDLNKTNGGSAASDIEAINANPNLAPTQKAELIKYISSVYPTVSSGSNLGTFPDIAKAATAKASKAQIGLGDWLLGIK